MGEKSLQKKKYILETARKVFMEKGYKNVTMKDIVEACDISRGGLYLYFGSTAEIFISKPSIQNSGETYYYFKTVIDGKTNIQARVGVKYI